MTRQPDDASGSPEHPLDRLARGLASGRSRRALLGWLGGGLAAAVSGGVVRRADGALAQRAPTVCAPNRCRSNADCYSNRCLDGVCRPNHVGGPCRCGGDCTSQFCVDQTQTCGAVSAGSACTTNSDCTSQHCAGGLCRPSPVGGPCRYGGDCTTQFCNDATHTCSALCAGSACRGNADCTTERCVQAVCQPNTGAGTCVCDVDCPPNWHCDPESQQCTPTEPKTCTIQPKGTPCEDSSQCCQGPCGEDNPNCRCLNEMCVGGCTTDSDCPDTGQLCVNGTCTASVCAAGTASTCTNTAPQFTYCPHTNGTDNCGCYLTTEGRVFCASLAGISAQQSCTSTCTNSTDCPSGYRCVANTPCCGNHVGSHCFPPCEAGTVAAAARSHR